jgi:hypothetical protein
MIEDAIDSLSWAGQKRPWAGQKRRGRGSPGAGKPLVRILTPTAVAAQQSASRAQSRNNSDNSRQATLAQQAY